MKKRCMVFALVLLLVFLSACANANQATKSSGQPTTSQQKSTNATTSQMEMIAASQTGEFFADTESQALFCELIANNPIDLDYKSDPTIVSVTQDMVALEKKYIDIWLEELTFSCQKFCDVLTTEDRENFKKAQEMWEASLYENYNFISSWLVNPEYEMHVGSVFSFERIAEFRGQVRQRTLYVKYLNWLLHDETKLDVSFQYQSVYY